jgi:hypothetical protein
MGIFAHPPFGGRNFHLPQHLDRFLHRFAPADPFMEDDPFGDLLSDREDRIERGHRLLKDHRDPVSPYFPHLFFGKGQKVFPLEEDPASDDLSGRIGYQP